MGLWNWNKRSYYYPYRRRRRTYRKPLPFMTEEEIERKCEERAQFLIEHDFFYVNGLKKVYISNCGFYLITYRTKLSGETSKGRFIVFNQKRWYSKDFLENGKRRIQRRTRDNIAKDLYLNILELA